MLSNEEVRAINLIEILVEEAEDAGRQVDPPPPEASQWPEDKIRAYFAIGCCKPALNQLVPPPSDTFDRWFPGLTLSGTACQHPKLRVLCFSNAGSAEDMYTSEGTGIRRAPSPLLEWCRANGAECLAVQPPGRNMRMREPAITTCEAMAAAVLPVVASRLYDVPYVVLAHSVGTWVAYEFLQLCRQQGVPLPRHAFLSAMASPDIPVPERPWRQQRSLNEQEFKEECRGWDINDLVFSGAMWPTYQPLLRADFTLFDEYEHRHSDAEPFPFPITTFWGSRDRRITEGMVHGWKRYTVANFQCNCISGNHLWPLDKEAKSAWLSAVVQQLPAM